MPVYQCANARCKTTFSARKADRLRGWARFCSKACAANFRERLLDRNGYYLTNAERGERDLCFVDGNDSAFDKHGAAKK